jgi:type VI secretion system secreted protein VgrG
MPISLTQDQRLGRLDTPLGKDVLCLARFYGTEGLSELFEFTVEAVSSKAEIDFDAAIGQNCSVTIQSYAKPDRIFNGVLVAADGIGGQANLYNYRLVLRPWLWFLSRTRDCRIFEKTTARDIIKKVFSDRGFSDFEDATTGDFPELDYCVQYRETDLAFVSRLMEQHGIYYFFEHDKDKHRLVLANGKSSHDDIVGHATLPVFLAEAQARRDREYLHHWSPARRLRSGKFELIDYDYLKPGADMKGDATASAKYTKSKLEIFDYPGKYKEKSDGETYAKYRLEAEQAADQRRSARGDAISLTPGGLVSLEKHPCKSENRKYLVLRVMHSYVAQSYYADNSDNLPSTSGEYEFLSCDIPFRAPFETPRPLVHGPQTAKVVGKDGEEIDVDEHGRILVRFFWDREKKQSCRVRVAQIWAGSGWGGQIIPRIGQEVVVEFLEGDPDRPLVTGVVHNGDNKHPFAMPANKTRSGIKSHSSKGGTGYNEFMFEDKKGSETIRMHAQKDYNVTVLDSETVTIGEKYADGKNSRTTTLKKGSDELKIEAGDQTIYVKQKQKITVGDEISITAINRITLTVGASSITLDPAQITLSAPLIKLN